MKKLNRKTVSKPSLPVRVLQFGEGNFLRAFTDWMIDIMNFDHDYDHGIAIVQPIEKGMVEMLQKQDNLYHHIYRGLKNGVPVSETRLIKSVQQSVNPFTEIEAYKKLALLDTLEIVISNTTEAGIVFTDSEKEMSELPETFPGKLTRLLWDRFKHFNGDKNKGLKFIPVELIEQNGEKLKDAILKYAELWNLSEDFIYWVEHYNYFANTLVDRIVTGFPFNEIKEIQERIGYEDEMVVTSELFHLFVIEADEELKKSFPADRYGFNLKYTRDITPYRTRKVRILNGAHTCMVAVGLYYEVETVGEFMKGEKFLKYLNQIIYNEIIPTMDLPEEELRDFADDVIERFKNPYIEHKLVDISLNSISKFKVRVLPSILDYFDKKGKLPEGLIKAFSFLIYRYVSGNYNLRDEARIIDELQSAGKESDTGTMLNKVLGNKKLWGQDLNKIPGFFQLVLKQYNEIQNEEIIL